MLADLVARHRWRLLTWLWIGWGILTLFSRAAIVDIPLERDEGCFAYIAQQWRMGSIPYRDVFDHKPPGIYAAYAMIQICLGESISALHWGTFLHSIPMFVGLVLICRALTSDPYAGLWACTAATLYMTNLNMYGHSANCEIFAIMPGTLAFGLALMSSSTPARGRLALAFLAGLCCGIAPLYKHVAILYIGPVLLAALVSGPDRFKRFCLMAVGCACIPSLFTAYFYLHGAWSEFTYCNWTYNRLYAGRVPLSYYPQFFLKNAIPIAATCTALIVTAGFGAYRLVQASVAKKERFPKPIAVVTLAWVFVGCLLIVPGGIFFPHYFVFTVPAVSLMVAAGLANDGQSTKRWKWRAGILGISLGQYCFTQGMVFLEPRANVIQAYYTSGNFFYDAVSWGEWLKRNSDQSDQIFIMGSEPELLYYAQRKCAGRFCYIYPLMVPASAPAAQAEMQQVLESDPPKIVVTIYSPSSILAEPQTPRGFIIFLESVLQNDYQPVAIFARKNELGFAHWQAALEPVLIDDPKMIAEVRSRQPGWYTAALPNYCAMVWKRKAP